MRTTGASWSIPLPALYYCRLSNWNEKDVPCRVVGEGAKGKIDEHLGNTVSLRDSIRLVHTSAPTVG